mgnify:FL=1
MLGGLGDNAEDARATVKALSGLGRLVMVVLGGRDAYRPAGAALHELGDEAVVVDVSAVRSIKIGGDVLIPWAGAEQGRYALDETRCGYGARDADEAVQTRGPAATDERRWLVSWQALPPAAARSMASDRRELGMELARLAERLGVKGSLGAWPASETESGPPGPLGNMLVPRAWGPNVERPDGTIAPHRVAVVAFDAAGPRIER